MKKLFEPAFYDIECDIRPAKGKDGPEAETELKRLAKAIEAEVWGREAEGEYGLAESIHGMLTGDPALDGALHVKGMTVRTTAMEGGPARITLHGVLHIRNAGDDCGAYALMSAFQRAVAPSLPSLRMLYKAEEPTRRWFETNDLGGEAFPQRYVVVEGRPGDPVTVLTHCETAEGCLDEVYFATKVRYESISDALGIETPHKYDANATPVFVYEYEKTLLTL